MSLFGIIYKNIKAGLGLAGLWMGGLIIMETQPGQRVYGKYLCKNKDSAVYRYYQEDSVLHPLFYLLGSIFALIRWYTTPFLPLKGRRPSPVLRHRRRNCILHRRRT
ncbi:MAG: hypothetical protein ACLR0U_29160 [Enterocloster clostridioformis]